MDWGHAFRSILQHRSFLDAVGFLWCHSVPCLLLGLHCRWRLKRIWRYSQVVNKNMLAGSGPLDKGTPPCTIPPMLPDLLAACAPSAEFSLHVEPNVGGAFLASSSGCTPPWAGPELCTFWSDLQQHLTELKLPLYSTRGRSQHMGMLGTLTALRDLDICCEMPPEEFEAIPLWDMSGEGLTLKLPNLASLQLGYLKHGKVLLSCPKLTEALFEWTDSFCIEVVDAALERLGLDGCKRVQVVFTSPEEQLGSLRTLLVSRCSEDGQHLIENVAQMRQLQKLKYLHFPAACMPTDFPQSLCKVRLGPTDWHHDLPEGLKELRKLTRISFNSGCKLWDITRPLAELLPFDGLREVRLGGCYICGMGDGSAWPSKDMHLLFESTVLDPPDLHEAAWAICKPSNFADWRLSTWNLTLNILQTLKDAYIWKWG